MSNPFTPGTIRLRGAGSRLTVEIEGQIGLPEWWSPDDAESRAATYENFRRQLDRLGRSTARRVDVRICSTGGNIHDALLIYETLCGLAASGAEITTHCFGYTASAATIVAQAATPGRRLVSSNALYLIHNATTALEGNRLDAEHTVRLLEETDARLAEIYAQRSGRPAAGFRDLMARNGGRGEWLSASSAVEAGLADRIHRSSPLAEVRNRVVGALRGWFRGTPGRSSWTEREWQPTVSPSLSTEDESRSSASPAVPSLPLRQRVCASTTRPREDPSVLSTELLGLNYANDFSRNSQAYDSDARRLRTSC
ncbi:MAG: Clp protease ClpP [Rikenella sp.]|nr:Clp protease ClpP [Rikenella sp.]